MPKATSSNAAHLTVTEMDALRSAGAAGVIAGQIIDSGGAALDCSYNRRVISADLASLRAIPKRLMVVQEAAKFEPLLAAIAGGLCTHLVVDAAMARRLLDHATASRRRILDDQRATAARRRLTWRSCFTTHDKTDTP